MMFSTISIMSVTAIWTNGISKIGVSSIGLNKINKKSRFSALFVNFGFVGMLGTNSSLPPRGRWIAKQDGGGVRNDGKYIAILRVIK